MSLSAKRIAARDHGAVFGTERGVGFRRLTTDDLHTVGHTSRASIRRRAKVAAKLIRQGSARVNDISPAAARKMNAELSALGLIEHTARDKIAEPVDTHAQRAEPVAVIARRMMDALKPVEAA